jgi:serine/threonine protein phosphatase PrpC
VVVLIQQGVAYWAHAGDSRLYLFRDARQLLRTTDHSYVERLRQQGIISVQQQEHHPQRNFVTRCLGGHSTLPEATQGKQTLQVGDTLLLCSDGLWGSIDEELMADVLYSEAGMGEIAEMLAREAAQSAFPESDNVTLIALRLLAIGDTGREPPVTRKPPLSRQDDLATAVSDLQNAINNFQREKQKE